MQPVSTDGQVPVASSRWVPLRSTLPVLVRRVLPVAVVAAVLGLAVRERATIADGLTSLSTAQGSWLAVAAACTVLLVVSGTVSQAGATHLRIPFWPLMAVQVAGTFANQVLPGGAGGMAVNVRYLRRRGLSRESALAAQALNVSAGGVVHVLLFVAALALAPWVTSSAVPSLASLVDIDLSHPADLSHTAVLAVLGVALLLAVATRLAWRRWGAALRERASAPWADIKVAAGVLKDPGRGLALWLGALAGPVLHVAVLWSVLHALSSPLPLLTVAVVYLGASALSAVIPSPGGFGALDVTLLGGLVTGGLSPAVATAVVVLYRLVTVWIPLLPGAAVLALLVRRRVV